MNRNAQSRWIVTLVTVSLADGARMLVRLPSADPMPVGARVRVTCAEPVLAFAGAGD